MEKSESTEDESLFLKIEGVLYEDLQELSVEDCTVSQEILGQRKSRLRTGRLVTVNKQQFALFKYKGIVYAVNERCPHMGGPLHLGDVEELGEARLPCVVCPWHSWKFSLQSGLLKVPHSKNVKLVTFPVRVDDKGQVFVGVKSLSPVYFSGEGDF